MNLEHKKLHFLKLKPIALIVLMGSFLRFLAFLSLKPWDPVVVARHLLVTDQWSYNHIAVSILNLNYGTESFWMPGWPAFIALVYTIFGEVPWVVLIFNIGLGAIGIIYFCNGVKLLINEKTAVIAGLLMACDPHQIIYSQTLLSENLFLPALMMFFYFLVKYLNENKIWHLISVSIIAGSLVYIRSIALYIYLIPLMMVFFLDSGRKFERLKRGVLVILVSFVMHAPISLKNYVNEGYWAVTSNGGFNALFIYAGSVYTNQLGYSSVEKDQLLQQRLDSLIGKGNTNQFDYDQAAKKLAVEIIMEYPMEFLTNHLTGCMNIYTSLATYQLSVVLGMDNNGLFMPGDYGASQLGVVDKFMTSKQPSVLVLAAIIALILVLEYSLALPGVGSMIKKKQLKQLFLPLCFILYFTLITGVIGSSARFRLPIAPFYLNFSAMGILYVKECFSLRKREKINEG